jgi:hypothetical protein
MSIKHLHDIRVLTCGVPSRIFGALSWACSFSQGGVATLWSSSMRVSFFDLSHDSRQREPSLTKMRTATSFANTIAVRPAKLKSRERESLRHQLLLKAQRDYGEQQKRSAVQGPYSKSFARSATTNDPCWEMMPHAFGDLRAWSFPRPLVGRFTLILSATNSHFGSCSGTPFSFVDRQEESVIVQGARSRPTNQSDWPIT